MKIKATDLLSIIQNHIDNHGDVDVLIYDDYESLYKTISRENVYRTMGNKLVIECVSERD